VSIVFTDERGLLSSPEQPQTGLKPCENPTRRWRFRRRTRNQNRDVPRRVAHVAQINRVNAQANAVNSTDLAWSRLVRDQEVGGSNPLAPTTPPERRHNTAAVAPAVWLVLTLAWTGLRGFAHQVLLAFNPGNAFFPTGLLTALTLVLSAVLVVSCANRWRHEFSGLHKGWSAFLVSLLVVVIYYAVLVLWVLRWPPTTA